MAGYDLSTDRLYGHIRSTKRRTRFLEFCRYLRTLHPPHVRIAIVPDNFSPHRSTKNRQPRKRCFARYLVDSSDSGQ